MEGDIRPCLRKPRIGFDDLTRVGVFERNNESLVFQVFHELTVIQGRLEQGFHLITGIFFKEGRSHRTTVDSNPEGDIMFSGDINQPGDLFRDSFTLFNVMQMAGIIPDFVNMGCHLISNFVILLEIYG